MKGKLFVLVMLVVLLSLSMTGCYWRKEVEASEVGLVMDDGVKISRVVGPGRYNDLWSWYAALKVIDATAKTVAWEDPDLVTKDKQPIGLSVSVTYSRDRDPERAKHMWQFYNAESTSDELLQAQVIARIPRVAKAVTAQYTLDQMLGIAEGFSRQDVQRAMRDMLIEELAEIDSLVLDVGINNISPSSDFMELLEEKANASVEREVAIEKAKTAVETLKEEKAQTEIEVEFARRNRLVAEEAAKIYELNDRWYELKRLEALGQVIGQNDKMWFVDPDLDLTMILSGNDEVIPLAGDE